MATLLLTRRNTVKSPQNSRIPTVFSYPNLQTLPGVLPKPENFRNTLILLTCARFFLRKRAPPRNAPPTQSHTPPTENGVRGVGGREERTALGGHGDTRLQPRFCRNAGFSKPLAPPKPSPSTLPEAPKLSRKEKRFRINPEHAPGPNLGDELIQRKNRYTLT